MFIRFLKILLHCSKAHRNGNEWVLDMILFQPVVDLAILALNFISFLATFAADKEI